MSGLYAPSASDRLNRIVRELSRRKVFVSYHHGGDQPYYDWFSRMFHDRYEAIRDNSLERKIQSDNTDYVMRKIREEYISGTSCTVVLIGEKSHERKYVDWEIKASLDKGHGLIGIVLPRHTRDSAGRIIVPDRFMDNLTSGFASWMSWDSLNPDGFKVAVEGAALRQKSLIRNERPLKIRNGV